MGEGAAGDVLLAAGHDVDGEIDEDGVAAVVFVATKTRKLTGSRTGAALVSVASVGKTLVGVFLLLLWALSWASE